MTMLDILRNRLPDGLTITEAKEKPSKYIVKFAYNGEALSGQGELMKACTPGKENAICDTTIQVIMTGLMLDKGDVEGAKHWMDYAKRMSTTKSGREKNSTVEAILKIIRSHNDVVTALEDSRLPVPESKMFMAMGIWHKLACEGSDITHMARDNGIDAKCNMQTGRIIVYGDSAAE